ncbi:MAG: aminoglycoside phosphotransferase family protein [Alphaproteobacteria bacterium]|nr:aminoglycoside phosphotransferase family protein [Alphaproteobacteria bacterium]
MPPGLQRLAAQKAGALWLAQLPQLIDQLADRWSLELGAPYPGATTSYVAPARRRGQQVVLKIQWPHAECANEADALRAWSGDGAIRLLDHDADRHALLLEACSPGMPLSSAEDVDPLDVLIDLLPRLWKPAGAPFRTVAEEAAGWARTLHASWQAHGRPCEKKLVDAAAGYLANLPASQQDQVLVHQDLHGDNVLSAEREPWLAIDPKPLLGERAFALAPIIRSFEFGHSKALVIGRLDCLSSALGLDRARVLGWTIAQTMAWSFESDYADRHHQTVRWLLPAA